MGRTYRQDKEEWAKKPRIKIKKTKEKKSIQKPSPTSRTEDTSEYDDLEMEAIDDEFIERFRKKGY